MKQTPHELQHEEMNVKLDAIMEYVARIPNIERRLIRVEKKVDTIEWRLGNLEQAFASHIKYDHS